ncbi:MAG TPA: hypothetical protein VGN54_15095 [Mycobacteriales bacterium]|jgi:hypothetical protein|nr:hypothetical protein [Mycobacteriales bacterium]
MTAHRPLRPGAPPLAPPPRRRPRLLLLALALLCGLATGCASSGEAATPIVTLHYAANDNIGAAGSFRPGPVGFNVADIETRAQLDALPAGVVGLIFLGLCQGADANFQAHIAPFVGAQNLFGFYLVDEPDPAKCPAAHLAAESAFIHAHVSGARTFVLVQNLAASAAPSYEGGYNRANTGVDLFGIDPYPCRSELSGCDYSMIHRYILAAEAFGIPQSAIVPVYQAFGGGEWVDDGGGRYLQPTPAQAIAIFQEWARFIPHPSFDYVYSWGVQRNDVALGVAPPSLQEVFSAHNRGAPLG